MWAMKFRGLNIRKWWLTPEKHTNEFLAIVRYQLLSTHHFNVDLRLGWLTVLSSVYIVEQELAFLIMMGEERTE